MEHLGWIGTIGCLLVGGGISVVVNRYLEYGFVIWALGIVLLAMANGLILGWDDLIKRTLTLWLPLMFLHIIIYSFVDYFKDDKKPSKTFVVKMKVRGRPLVMENIRRGVSVMASAGSGKTESVIYNFLRHFQKAHFSGIIHDYKDFEITEMAYPLWQDEKIPFRIVSFGPIYHRVNPIAPRYLPDEESVHEVSRVLLENLMEHKDSDENSTSRFFKDAAEGLVSGLIWRLKKDYPHYCTLPHLIALFQQLSTKSLIKFLRGNITARAMADAFISGVGSERQTAGVLSTLANAIKKISTRKIFMVLSADEIPLDINNEKNPAVIALVNNPQKDASLSPVIATIIHTISKQMSQRNRKPSFMLLEEASTLRLLNMHRIPATLRSYDIVSVYVLQDKIQNDMMYGEKASKAILSNLSYQFFGKVNDPDTARYYERFFELVKIPTRSVSKSSGLNLESRITEGEKEVSKRRAEVFFRLRQGEFVVFADGKDRKVRFVKPEIQKGLPKPLEVTELELEQHYLKVHHDIGTIFK
ncbi:MULTISPECIES: type IV secretory system conjugative DNA transfer family protein [Flagellimonas]|uniref:Type IV secretion-system coupling protein DNA-binding domain-containing protein n=2 Tax=Flagellimonas TaxID=444459 RepID=A0A1H2RDQ4_9FLAO|nr:MULTISPECIES: type IV secretion system DNA-binding domain-containing protein [Allomuricauda]MDF0706258.1 type IV secretion system DNA-binding domain-containing protein [[Muricauda] okinawensis]SDQ61814.1 Type IV secretion-system coupling protein DNA-binding domain-containing protein [Allomuricauda zhangzhouensis]SDW16799.1 Type IV secretion-system coupling protein DNA-binding domain-containing protein [Allomuricauda zhangzhouensis]